MGKIAKAVYLDRRGKMLDFYDTMSMLPKSRARFLEFAHGKAVLVGAKTYRKMERPFRGANNMVISWKDLDCRPGFRRVKSLEEAKYFAGERDMIVAGGISIHDFRLDIDEFYCTVLDTTTRTLNLNLSSQFQIVRSSNVVDTTPNGEMIQYLELKLDRPLR